MFFSYKDKFLFAEDLSVRVLAEQYGSPLYIYSKQTILDAYTQFSDALAGIPHHIHYAVKANSNLGILSIFHQLGAGFDIVSGGELARILAIGASPDKVIFSGVGKSQEEITLALSHDIYCFQVESWPELERIQMIAARLNKIAPIAFRVNPDIPIDSHPYISTGLKENKFGVPLESALELYLQAASLPNISPIGIACHIGSNIDDIAPFEQALTKLFDLFSALTQEGIDLEYINLGGGLGLKTSIQAYGAMIKTQTQAFKNRYPEKIWTLLIEPGRALIAQAGILVSKVEYLKTMDEKHFCIVDAGMNLLIRPALYDALHDIIPIYQHQSEHFTQTYDIVGPICETGDFLGKQRALSVSMGDYVAILTAGAYGMSMANHYNSRPMPAEILIHQDKHWVIRTKESYRDLFTKEQLINLAG